MRNDAIYPTYKVKGKGFGIRAVAYITDTIIILLFGNAVGFVVGIITGIILIIADRNIPTEPASTQCLDLVLGIVSVLVYFTVFEGLYGASPGKLITGMRVVKDDGEPCNIGTALHRGLWRFIDGIIFGAVAFSSMKPPLQQRLGDKNAHTLVVGRNEPVIRHPRDWYWFLLAMVTYGVLETATVALVLIYTLVSS